MPSPQRAVSDVLCPQPQRSLQFYDGFIKKQRWMNYVSMSKLLKFGILKLV